MGLPIEVAREYIDKFPKLPNRTLARKLREENKALYSSIEAARGVIRVAKGANGNQHREHIAPSHFTREAFEKRFKFAEGEVNNYLPFVLKSKKAVILNDLHIPYHNKNAIVKALAFAHEHEVDTIILNGDVIDCYQLSSFVKDPRARKFADEIADCKIFLSELRDNFPDVQIIYKEGNHEERFKKYLKTHAPIIFDDIEYRLDVKLELASKRITWIDNKKPIHMGRLTILHGHEYRGGGGVNSARWLFLRTFGNAVCGHFHTVSQHIDKDIRQKPIGTWSMGCMCDLNPDYMPLNKWQLGFGYVKILDNKGNFRFQNIDLEDYE